MCSTSWCARDFAGKKKGSQHYCHKSHIPEKINEYVRCTMKDNVDIQSRIVYMDESYIHNNLKGHSYLTNTTSKESRFQIKAPKMKSGNCLRHSSETLWQLSAQWPNLKFMRWFSLHHTTPICSRLRSCGQILKVKSAGNTPRRQPFRALLFTLSNDSNTYSHTHCKAVPTRLTSTLNIDGNYLFSVTTEYW